jgi:D-psicose/D-tagatose/L-ribulose 3-epimerase
LHDARLRYAYNTNGAANHRLDDLLELLAESGYDGVALTLDHHHLDPFAPRLGTRAEALGMRLRALGLGIVVETGARFLLDPRRKHEPTLVTPEPAGRALRLDFLRRAVDVAAATGAEAVSFWAGTPWPGTSPDLAWSWLVEGVSEVVAYARGQGQVAALEPEPGMVVGTVADWERLAAEVPGLALALDTGHCLVDGTEPVAALREQASALGTVAIEDMRRGVHEHLPFGEGDMDLPAVVGALAGIGFGKLVCVELSRESARAHEMIPAAIRALRHAEEVAAKSR